MLLGLYSLVSCIWAVLVLLRHEVTRLLPQLATLKWNRVLLYSYAHVVFKFNFLCSADFDPLLSRLWKFQGFVLESLSCLWLYESIAVAVQAQQEKILHPALLVGVDSKFTSCLVKSLFKLRVYQMDTISFVCSSCRFSRKACLMTSSSSAEKFFVTPILAEF
jgi:hypothetical protein